jgi:hypothetical protein
MEVEHEKQLDNQPTAAPAVDDNRHAERSQNHYMADGDFVIKVSRIAHL